MAKSFGEGECGRFGPWSGVSEKSPRESLIYGPVSFDVSFKCSYVCSVDEFGGNGGVGAVWGVDEVVGYRYKDVRQVWGGELFWPCPVVDVFLIVPGNNDPGAVPKSWYAV